MSLFIGFVTLEGISGLLVWLELLMMLKTNVPLWSLVQLSMSPSVSIGNKCVDGNVGLCLLLRIEVILRLVVGCIGWVGNCDVFIFAYYHLCIFRCLIYCLYCKTYFADQYVNDFHLNFGLHKFRKLYSHLLIIIYIINAFLMFPSSE